MLQIKFRRFVLFNVDRTVRRIKIATNAIGVHMHGILEQDTSSVIAHASVHQSSSCGLYPPPEECLLVVFKEQHHRHQQKCMQSKSQMPHTVSPTAMDNIHVPNGSFTKSAHERCQLNGQLVISNKARLHHFTYNVDHLIISLTFQRLPTQCGVSRNEKAVQRSQSLPFTINILHEK